MIRTISVNLEEMPLTCFDCMFSSKEYFYATCPFLQCTIEDGAPTPKKCPLKKKNYNQIYTFDTNVYK